MTKQTLNALKDYISDNGAFNFISYDWLEEVANNHDIDVDDLAENRNEADMTELTEAIRKGLEQYDDLMSMYNAVLLDGMNPKWGKKILQKFGEHMTEDECGHFDYSVGCFVN